MVMETLIIGSLSIIVIVVGGYLLSRIMKKYYDKWL